MSTTLSVVIPAYNVEDYIVPAIDSALSQSLRDLEVIVIEDGSIDSTAERIATITDPRLKVIRQENRGLAAARNRGIRAATGKYIGFLDGDDVWNPDKARSHVHVMEEDPTVGIVFSYMAYIDESGKSTGQLLVTNKKNPTLRDLLIRNHITSSAVVRKACFEAAGEFDEQLRASEDWDMWVRIMHATNYRAQLVPRVMAGYRVRPGSLTMNFEHHIRNGHMVVDKFNKTVPSFTPRLRRRALGELYRILSRKALSSGQYHTARVLAKSSLSHCPTLFLRDFRALGTFTLLATQSFLPSRMRHLPYLGTRFVMRVFYLRYANELQIRRRKAQSRERMGGRSKSLDGKPL